MGMLNNHIGLSLIIWLLTGVLGGLLFLIGEAKVWGVVCVSDLVFAAFMAIAGGPLTLFVFTTEYILSWVVRKTKNLTHKVIWRREPKSIYIQQEDSNEQYD